MYTKKVYSFKSMALWTRYETGIFITIALLEVLLFNLCGKALRIPFTPIALIGTAVAFIIGFQSNSAYGRIWEARQIWGAIVNSSRTFGMMTKTFLNNEQALEPVADKELQRQKKILIHRHIAWMTALRYAMRQPKPWEYVMKEYTNKEWAKKIYVPEFHVPFEEAIAPYLSKEELSYIEKKDNKQTAILYLQSQHLQQLKEQGLLWAFSHLKLNNVLEELFNHQGKSERIKNFPYPRQFASILLYFTWIFILSLPLAIATQFEDIGAQLEANFHGIQDWSIWLSVPFSVAIMWIFHTMNRIGRVGENPFEGSTNDVPISTIARGIEIDLRQNLEEDLNDIPQPFPANVDTQM
ncbi:bestrophin family ion channel [Echinicola sediminis]